ncbi:hypothetical protein T4C_9283, partial [Trichinella pseudospiralis]
LRNLSSVDDQFCISISPVIRCRTTQPAALTFIECLLICQAFQLPSTIEYHLWSFSTATMQSICPKQRAHSSSNTNLLTCCNLDDGTAGADRLFSSSIIAQWSVVTEGHATTNFEIFHYSYAIY